jgi:hypothetical protein
MGEYGAPAKKTASTRLRQYNGEKVHIFNYTLSNRTAHQA